MLVIGMLLQTDAVAAAVGPRVYCTSCTLGLVLLIIVTDAVAAAVGSTVYCTSCMLGRVLLIILMLVLQLLMVLLYTLPPEC